MPWSPSQRRSPWCSWTSTPRSRCRSPTSCGASSRATSPRDAHERVLVRAEAEALVQRAGLRVAGRHLELDGHGVTEPGQGPCHQVTHEAAGGALAARAGRHVELVEDAHLAAELVAPESAEEGVAIGGPV